jgi:hypothetical protein
VCGRFFRPNVRSRRHQRYCSKRCARRAKRERDRQHKKHYRATGLGREQRRRENTRLRRKLGWAEYIRFSRRAKPFKAAARERARSRRYYQRHREQILAKRRAQRAARKAAQEACSH